MIRFASLVGAFGALSLFVPDARAGTLALESRSGCGGDAACAKAGDFAVDVVVFRGFAGEANRVRVSRDGMTLTVADAGAPIRPGAGCAAVDANSARCPMSADPRAALPVEISTGDGDDAVTVDGDLGVRLPIYAGPGADTVVGGAEADHVDPGAGDDTVDGGAGVDTIDYADRTAAVTVDLGTGTGGQAGETDRLTGIEVAWGGDGADALVGGPGPDVLDGWGGADVLRGGPGNDELYGYEGGDRIFGEAGDDLIATDPEPGDGVSAPLAAPAADFADGGAGDDAVHDDAGGRNVLRGGAGDDGLYGGPGRDRLEGGRGDDQLAGDFDDPARAARAGRDVLLGGAGRDLLVGGPAADRLFGGAGADRLVGGRGRDRLDGGAGRDRLHGRDRRRDRLRCGRGRDIAGADRRDRTAGCERRVVRRGLKVPAITEAFVPDAGPAR